MSQRIRFAALAVAALLAASLAGVAQASRCTAVTGSFTGLTYFPPECPSPIGICFSLSSAGDLQTVDFVFASLTNANDPADPTRFAYTGSSTITLGDGRQVETADDGVLHSGGADPTVFETTATIVGGDRQYRRATGTIVVTGVLDLATGTSNGTYSGTVCKS